MPAWVDGDFLVLRHLPSIGSGNDYESTFSLPLGCNPCKLQPGPKSAIKIRLDDGPMRPHLLNECVNTHLSLSYLFSPTDFYRSLTLVDRDGTLHAQFNVKLTQTLPPSIPPLSIDFSDGASIMTSAQKSTHSKKPRSLMSKIKDKRNRDVPDGEKKVYTSLRRGGR
jgi:hypothetical protein